MALVQEIFDEEDAVQIIRIPVCGQLKDTVVWHFDKKGIFSVKSAYKVFVNRDACSSRRGQASGSGAIPDQTIVDWKQPWQLECPGKVIHFLWRLVHDSLAVRT